MSATLHLRARERNRWVYVTGNRQGLRALHYAIGQLLASRSREIFEGPGYTVFYNRSPKR